MRESKQVQELINFAKVAEQTQRHDDMCRFVREAVKKCTEVNAQTRSLLSNAYKCKVSSRRTAWRALSTLQCKEANSKSRTGTIIQFYKESIEKEIRQICTEVISLMNSLLTAEKLETKARLEFLKMKGDHYRYLCEVGHDQQLKKLQKEAQNAYSKALELLNDPGNKDSLKSSSLKLGVCLNFSVFYYQIMNMTNKAISICEKGFNEALQSVSDLEDARFTDTVTILQLMHDNILAWKEQLEKSNQQ